LESSLTFFMKLKQIFSLIRFQSFMRWSIIMVRANHEIWQLWMIVRWSRPRETMMMYLKSVFKWIIMYEMKNPKQKRKEENEKKNVSSETLKKVKDQTIQKSTEFFLSAITVSTNLIQVVEISDQFLKEQKNNNEKILKISS